MFRRHTRVDALKGPGGAQVVVQRTNRKRTVGIIIENGGVRIRAPQRLANWRIQQLIDERAEWISAKLRLLAAQPEKRTRTYTTGEPFIYLGKDYRLLVTDDQDSSIGIAGDRLIAPAACDRADRITDWYRRQAETILREATARFAALMDVTPRSIRVREYKSQWGSCNSRGDIRYNSRLILAPIEVVDYVVVHELAHLHNLNHSRQYWDSVVEIIPDHRERRKWLRQHGSTLWI